MYRKHYLCQSIFYKDDFHQPHILHTKSIISGFGRKLGEKKNMYSERIEKNPFKL